MKLRRSKIIDPFDLWPTPDKSETKTKAKKVHPSDKRNKKNPLPHPGQSYNPDPESHRQLLRKIAEKELKYIRKKKSLDKAVNVKVDRDELCLSDKQEMESGLEHLLNEDSSKIDDSDTDQAFSDYDEKDFEAISRDKKVREKRKTRQQRMRQLKDKLQRKAAKLRKLKNIRLTKIDGVKKLMKELDDEAVAKRKINHKLRRERFCQRLEESDPIYCLSSELPSELRKVSCPMDKIVKEQLENFKSRLMIEPTAYQSKKSKSSKSFDK